MIASAFRHLWHTLKGSWEEFEQHSECLEHNQHRLNYQASVQRGQQTSVPVQTSVSCHIAGSTQTTDAVQSSAQIPDSAVSGIPRNVVAASSATTQMAATSVTSSVALSSLKPAVDANTNRNTVVLRRVVSNKAVVQQTEFPDVANAMIPDDACTNEQAVPLPGKWAQAKNFVRRTMAVFGSANNAQCESVTPRGLQNYSGQNLCFINAVLQALSKTSSLADDMIAARSPSRPTIVCHLANLFEGLTTSTTVRGQEALATNEFRMAASLRSRGLIVSPFSNQKQPQQDVAEFLTWLLSELHTCLNGAAQPSAVTSVQSNQGQQH